MSLFNGVGEYGLCDFFRVNLEFLTDMYEGRVFELVPAGNLVRINVVVMCDGRDRLTLMDSMDNHFMAMLGMKVMLFSSTWCDSEFLTYSNDIVG